MSQPPKKSLFSAFSVSLVHLLPVEGDLSGALALTGSERWKVIVALLIYFAEEKGEFRLQSSSGISRCSRSNVNPSYFPGPTNRDTYGPTYIVLRVARIAIAKETAASQKKPW